MSNILITGATGNVGKETIKRLIKSDNIDKHQIIAGVRNIKKAKINLNYQKIKFRKFDFKDYSTIEGSLKDIDKIFLVRPPAISKVKKYILPIIKEAGRSKVKQLVFLSIQGVEKIPIVPHFRIEKYIKETKIPYTFLRPSFFMQNLTTTHRDEIKYNNEIYIPAGNGKTNFIDVRDIADVASLVLTKDFHKYKAYELTGKKALSYYKVADILSNELDRKIEYKNPSIIKFFIRKKKEGVNISKIVVMTGIYTAAKLGKADETNSQLISLLKREPTSFSQFVKDYKNNWI